MGWGILVTRVMECSNGKYAELKNESAFSTKNPDCTHGVSRNQWSVKTDQCFHSWCYWSHFPPTNVLVTTAAGDESPASSSVFVSSQVIALKMIQPNPLPPVFYYHSHFLILPFSSPSAFAQWRPSPSLSLALLSLHPHVSPAPHSCFILSYL